MCILANLLLFLLSLFFLFPNKATAQSCSAVTCSTSSSSVPIRFPFRIEGRQPETCGYPGFNLSCSSSGGTVLKLPNSGEFFVRDIDYLSQSINLYDPKDCLPQRLLKLNLSASPFFPSYYSVNYTFLNCPMNLSSEFAISCLSNSTNTVLAVSDSFFARLYTLTCDVMFTSSIPISLPGRYYYRSSSADLHNDLQLSWASPKCSLCEANGGLCGFKSNISQEIGCIIHSPKAGYSRTAMFGIICTSIALPIVIVATVIGCCALRSDTRNGSTTNNLRQGSNSTTVTPQPTAPVVTIGLDESTIASFAEVVLGESRRLSGPNDITCPICLSEYQPKEILRCIPDCKHCFHVSCIDEWLKMNSTCPVCRKCPSPVQPSETT